MNKINIKYENSLVIDNGSDTIKAGLNISYPSMMFSSQVGKSRTLFNAISGTPATFVADECQSKRDILNLTQPIQNGLIHDWDDLELIYSHIFTKLDLSPKEQPVLLTEHSSSTQTHREKLTELMLEKFQVPFLNIVNQAVLALYATDRTTGVVLDSGQSQTQCIAVNQGKVILSSFKLDLEKLTGLSMTSHLQDTLFNDKEYVFGSGLFEKEIIQEIKEKFCCAALNYKLEMQSNKKEREFKLPNDRTISIGNERFKCVEQLFNSERGFQEMIFTCIKDCEEIISQNELYANICLSGGNTMFPVIGERLKIELVKMSPNTKIEITARPDRKYLTWIGGSKWASSVEQEHWTSKQEYNEYGSSIIHRKLQFS